MAFLPREKLEAMGFCRLGENVLLSDKASIYNPAMISLGDHVRIDDFCILSAGAGGIIIGRYIHLGCYTSFIGSESIIIRDFASIAPRVTIYSSIDETSGSYLVGAMSPMEYRHLVSGKVVVEKHALVGTGSVVFPNVTLGLGSHVGALSLVRENCDPFWVYGGIPAKKIKPRERKDLLDLEKDVR